MLSVIVPTYGVLKRLEAITDIMSSSKTETINCKSILSDKKLVPDDQIKLFCQILQDNRVGEVIRHADGSYHIHQERPRTSKLNFPLSRPDPITRKLLLPKQSEYAYLCDEHKPLNADFVHQWFQYLQLEVGARLEILRASTREHIGGYSWDNIVKPLTRLHRIWMRETEVKLTFGKFCHKGFENTIDMIDPTYQEDGCEACILKRVGSHINTLHALRCIVKSRLSLESHAKHPNRLRLLRLIEPWIELLEDKYAATEINDQREIQQRWVTGLSEELYEKRKELELDRHRRRRAQRYLLEVYHSNSQKYKQYVRDLEGSAVDGNVHDAENDIIDSYAALRAAQRASVIASVDIMAGNIPEYPSYQIQAATPRSEGNSSPFASPAAKTYIESRYSIDTIRNNDRVVRGLSAQLGDLQPPPKAAVAGRYDIRESGATVWPVHHNGSTVQLRASLTGAGRAVPNGAEALGRSTSRKNKSEQSRSSSTRTKDSSRTRKSSNTGEYESQADRYQMPNDEFRRHYRTSQVSESDSYYVQDRRRQSSRAENGENRWSDVSSTGSGYSEYYRRNRK